MTTYRTRASTSAVKSGARSMGFSVLEAGSIIKLRRGRIIGEYISNGRFEPGVLKLTGAEPDERDSLNAVRDLGRALNLGVA